ncbi:Cytoplasmic tRNA 2-thiolation protein 1 [Dendrobium catenatum]|uniref:Cytoplasmic tRNA 2-thiolation protein 1 n=1 Tax=Dendrobium catenatum TaxID=906689 RepID=A0A2I0WM70_9ASPA|nr:Cytoplasmic tRNA 2-thiolation protein 1 [Dendrobium catenatum]
MEEGKRAVSRLCSICSQRRPALKRPKTLEQICRECFYAVFEEEIHRVIMENHLFKAGERIAVAASGDSTVLAYVLSELNRRHDYGLDLFLLSVDEGITGYRDDSLETVKRNEIQVERRKIFHTINEVTTRTDEPRNVVVGKVVEGGGGTERPMRDHGVCGR